MEEGVNGQLASLRYLAVDAHDIIPSLPSYEREEAHDASV